MLGDSLAEYKSLFPPLVNRMISVGEKSGKLDETLLYLADFYEYRVDESVKRFTASLEPILLIIIGFIVAVIALSIVTPIYSITGNLHH